jgi:hypothetical protein
MDFRAKNTISIQANKKPTSAPAPSRRIHLYFPNLKLQFLTLHN